MIYSLQAGGFRWPSAARYSSPYSEEFVWQSDTGFGANHERRTEIADRRCGKLLNKYTTTTAKESENEVDFDRPLRRLGLRRSGQLHHAPGLLRRSAETIVCVS